MKVRWPFLVVLVGAGVWGFFAHRENAKRESEILAITTCPFRGDPVTRISNGLSIIEMAHVTAHEGVHAQQCRDLGPVKYRLRNLTSKLSLEAPAYCAGAAARLALGMDSAEVRIRLLDDAVEALRRTADSAKVVATLGEACPAIMRVRPPGTNADQGVARLDRDLPPRSGVRYIVPTFRSTAFAFAMFACTACSRETPEANATTVAGETARTDSIAASAFPASYKRIAREKWTVGPEGGGALRFRMRLAEAIVATKGDFFTRQANLDCSYFRTSHSPIGVKVMVVDRVVARIDVDSGSTATPEGIRIGSTEAQVKAAYGDRAETGPHKYTDGHVITVSGDGDFRFVFETDGSRVTRYRVGVMPAVEWVEGCS